MSLTSLLTRGLEFGIDFTGGILLEIGYKEPADIAGIRGDLSDAGYSDAKVQLFGDDDVVWCVCPRRKVPSMRFASA